MCGRYGFIPTKDFANRFQLEKTDFNLRASYNVSPGMLQPVIIVDSGGHKAELMKWGLIPFWAKDPKIAYRTINARAEEVAAKPAFREPFRKKRCLVPANGFYEWEVIAPREREPYWFQLKSGAIFAFAGLYDIWKDVEGKEHKSYTIITTRANTLVNKVHPRMPVIVKHKLEAAWADNARFDPAVMQNIMQPYPPEEMEAWHVGRKVGNPATDGPDLIRPVANL